MNEYSSTMEIKEITNKEIWENFLLECKEKTFLSSWNWGEFNKMMGNNIWRLGIYESEKLKAKSEKLIGVALVVKIVAKRGTFLFVPHGPNLKLKVKSEKLKVLESLLAELKKIGKEEKVGFIRIAPTLERSEENIEIFGEIGFINAPIHMHPEVTWELDIKKPEEELLSKMRKTTRYLIRQAQKNSDIRIEQGLELRDIEKFNQLYQETVDRHHFVPFSLEYLKNEFLAFRDDNQVLIFLGKYKGDLISSGIFIFWQNIAFYHQGASSLRYPKIPVSYLLLWEAIREAKNRSCQKFNFWGIAPENLKNHPWAGLTLFKIGFSGYKKEYVKTQDFPLSKKYWLTYIFEKLRKTKRGL